VHEWGAFRDQIIGTAILLMLILAITDLLNTRRRQLGRSSSAWSVVASAWRSARRRLAINRRVTSPAAGEFITGYHSAWRDHGATCTLGADRRPLIGGLLAVSPTSSSSGVSAVPEPSRPAGPGPEAS